MDFSIGANTDISATVYKETNYKTKWQILDTKDSLMN